MTSAVLVEPAFSTCPPFTKTDGPIVCDLAAMAGLPPDPHQVSALNVIFALGPDKRAAAFECAVIMARQNGKSALFQQAALGWLFVTEQRLIVWSAHEMGTTREAFRGLVELIEGCGPLRKRLATGPSHGVFRGNGEECIELASGQRLKFKARTHGGGRGLSGDKVVLDEAMFLKPQHMGSLWPTLSARPDPQVVYGGSAGLAESEIWRSIRDRGRAGGDPSLAYIEFCAPENMCEADTCSHALDTPGCALDDLELVRMANPALDRRISVEYVQAERRALPPTEYGRERLGWWDRPDVGGIPLIAAHVWEALTDAESTPVDPVAFGVYVSSDRSVSAIGVAGRRADGRFHVGVVAAQDGGKVDTLPGTGWIPGRVAQLFERWAPCAVIIDGHSAAASLIQEIEEAGVAVTVTNAIDMTKACGVFYDAVAEDNLRHRGATALARAVTSGRKRDLSDSWAWDRKDRSSDITQLVAVTLALHGLVLHGLMTPEVEPWAFFG